MSLNDYMMKIVRTNWVALMCYVDVWGAKGLWSHEVFIEYVGGNGASHLHWTSLLWFGSSIRSNDDVCEVKLLYV